MDVRSIAQTCTAFGQKMKRPLQKPFDESLAELVSRYAKSGGEGGKLTLEEINEFLRSQIQANEESGEE
jgi:hypothetical protein